MGQRPPFWKAIKSTTTESNLCLILDKEWSKNSTNINIQYCKIYWSDDLFTAIRSGVHRDGRGNFPEVGTGIEPIASNVTITMGGGKIQHGATCPCPIKRDSNLLQGQAILESPLATNNTV